MSSSEIKVSPLNDSTVNVATSGTTDKGTKILRKTDNNMDKNSFLKILSAQLTNLDPTQNQDSSAYVSQMAQFASMEQMQNLNTTMSDSAHQQMVGKTVITNEKDNNNQYVKGYVTQVIKRSGGTYLEIQVNGKTKEVAAENIIGVVDVTDSNTTANSRTALNSDFLAASALADKGQNIVIATTNEAGETVLVKGKVVGAYIDTVDSATVKVKVQVEASDGKSASETKTYDYGDIVRAGDLTSDEMNVKLNTSTNSNSSTGNTEKAETPATPATPATQTPAAGNSATNNASSSAVSDVETEKENAFLADYVGV